MGFKTDIVTGRTLNDNLFKGHRRKENNFQKGGKRVKWEKRFYGGKEIEIAKNYEYLGVDITPTSAMNYHLCKKKRNC